MPDNGSPIPSPPSGAAAAGPESLTRPARAASWLRPAVVLPILGVVMIASILWTPQLSQTDNDSRLTTYSTGPRAAAGFYEVAQRLGWRTTRRRTPFDVRLDTSAVYAVLHPVIPLSKRESGVLLDAVRRGAGLLYVVTDSSALGDSLHVRRSDSGYAMTPLPVAGSEDCRRERGVSLITWFDNGVHLYRLLPHGAPPSDTTMFVTVELPGTTIGTRGTLGTLGTPRRAPAAFGFALGRGRVAVLSDADLLRNNVVRVCRWGIGTRMVAALDWVSGGRRPPLVFDEYHQAFGDQPGTWGAAWRFLTVTAPGRALAQVVVAALVLLAAVAVRPIAPRSLARIERRSALEHVGALARAYERIGATRTAVRRLALGLRRRHGHGAWSASPRARGGGAGDPDERFLGAISASHPEVAADASRILDAERRAVAAPDLVAVADSVDRIDRVFPSLKT